MDLLLAAGRPARPRPARRSTAEITDPPSAPAARSSKVFGSRFSPPVCKLSEAPGMWKGVQGIWRNSITAVLNECIRVDRAPQFAVGERSALPPSKMRAG